MIPLNRMLISSYRLSIVTMPLTKAVWPQFAMQVLGVQTVTVFRENTKVVGVRREVAVGKPYSLAQSYPVKRTV